jgi:CBS domain-containing protein
MRVRDVMTTDVTTVAPDTDLREVAALLVQERSSGVPGVVSVVSRLHWNGRR